MKKAITVALLILTMMLSTSGCATAQETLDLSQKVTEEGLWLLVAVDASIGGFIDHIESHPDIEEFTVTFPDDTKQKRTFTREEALTELKAIRAKIKPVMDGLTRLNTNIQKGSKFVAFLKKLLEAGSAKDLVMGLLPGLRTEIESVLPGEDEPEEANPAD